MINKKHRNIAWFSLLLLALVFAAPGAALAFDDLAGNPAKEAVEQLKQEGIVSGVDAHSFKPNEAMTNAQAVYLIVKGMNLNLHAIKFVKAPKASDYFTNVPNDAWYAESFIIAQLNSLSLPQDIAPDEPITRELFADLLYRALLKTGDYAFIELFFDVKDGGEVSEGRMESIQKLLAAKIAKLDENGMFAPRKAITRGDAAVMLHAAMLFVNEHSVKLPGDETVTVTDEKVNDEVNKVTLSWGMKPNPGYRLTIDGIRFDGGEAVIRYSLHLPRQDHSYVQALTEAKASTYVSSEYRVSIEKSN